MRTLLFARTQVALPLSVCLSAPVLINVLLKEDIEAIIRDFEQDENAVLIATPPFQVGWRADCEAGVFILDGTMVSPSQCMARVRTPNIEAPNVNDLKTWYEKRQSQIEQVKALPSD